MRAKRGEDQIEAIVTHKVSLIDGALLVRFKNLRTDTSVREAKFCTWIRPKRTGFSRFGNSWELVNTICFDSMGPMDGHDFNTGMEGRKRTSFPVYISDRFPNYMSEKATQDKNGLTTRQGFRVPEEHQDREWEIRHWATYRTAISGSREQKSSYRLSIRPELEENENEWKLSGWSEVSRAVKRPEPVRNTEGTLAPRPAVMGCRDTRTTGHFATNEKSSPTGLLGNGVGGSAAFRQIEASQPELRGVIVFRDEGGGSGGKRQS